MPYGNISLYFNVLRVYGWALVINLKAYWRKLLNSSHPSDVEL